MSCAHCREYLLEASGRAIDAALAGSGPAAEHLAQCGACRALAGRIGAAEKVLAEGLSSLRPRGQDGEAARAAVTESARRRQIGRRRWTLLAAAAAIAGLLAVRAADVSRPPAPDDAATMASSALPAPLGLEVEPLDDESVAVFETDDELYVCEYHDREKLHVLVVEDDEAARDLMRVTLEDAGCRVTEATNGAGALEILKENVPDLILLDLNLPRKDGREVLAEAAATISLMSTGFASAHSDSRS